ncbi:MULTISPECIES: MliC family protein [unclassified Luteimonas]
MKVPLMAMLAACAACACSSPPAAVDPSPPDMREVAFSCDNGESLSVRFHAAQERAVLLRNGDAIELAQQPSASGFVYSNGPNTIRGKGDDLTVEIGRMVPIQCKAG